ncbi:hypothetical protein FJN14_10680 [Alteromonas mediterranea]|uniref:hypothetical protein n=1 Tax=Alteromonas mediterranea TaxID=314275 RepID=UPI0011308721|nr:hypothetical protein [Alteromonas mediterranea]QDG38890.1 hypothetical protein FJN14_10680 [Alteromonas mediterranea]
MKKKLYIALLAIMSSPSYAENIDLDAAISHYKGSKEIAHKSMPDTGGVQIVNPDIPRNGRKNRVYYSFSAYVDGACTVHRNVGSSFNSQKLRTKGRDKGWAYVCSYELPNYGICGITAFENPDLNSVRIQDVLEPDASGWNVRLYAKKSGSPTRIEIACLI